MKESKEMRWLSFLIGIIGIIGVSLILYKGVHQKLIFIPAGLCLAVYVLCRCFEARLAPVRQFLLRFRWLAAFAVFVLCVLLRLHGSSIGMFDRYFPTVTNQKEAEAYCILGEERPIRSDEWAVHTPTGFSQYYNDFRMKSTQMSVSDMNMVLDYYSPVKDITILGKPFSWGYLLFGNEVGLSWYWCGMVILLFMSAFEMGMILTKKHLRLSVVCAVLIGLSPVMQWWFIPHMPIVFIYAMLLFDIGYHLLTAKRSWFRWLMTGLAAMAAIGFALSFFPSCQLISALVAIALLAACLVRDRDKITFTKKHWYHIVLAAGTAGAVILYFLVTYREDLHLLMNTAYPGKRVSTGRSDGLADLFTELRSLYLPYREPNVRNSSELATYIHFAPLFLLLFPRINACLRQKNKNDRIVGRTLCIALLVEMVYMCAGFSETLSRLTLFSYVNRMKISYGWTATIFTVWSLDMIFRYRGMFRRWEKIAWPLAYGAFYCTLIDQSLRENLSMTLLLGEIFLFVLVLLCAMLGWERITSYILSGIMCVAGLTVNPLCRGISPITNHPLSAFVAERVEEEPQARWTAVGTDFVASNFLMANGARVLGATNFYPDVKRWKILDPSGQYDDVYNRYTNQQIVFAEEATWPELKHVDLICLHLNPDDLKKLDIRYVLIPEDAHALFASHGIEDTLVFQQDNYRVYRLRY